MLSALLLFGLVVLLVSECGCFGLGGRTAGPTCWCNCWLLSLLLGLVVLLASGCGCFTLGGRTAGPSCCRTCWLLLPVLVLGLVVLLASGCGCGRTAGPTGCLKLAVLLPVAVSSVERCRCRSWVGVALLADRLAFRELLVFLLGCSCGTSLGCGCCPSCLASLVVVPCGWSNFCSRVLRQISFK